MRATTRWVSAAPSQGENARQANGSSLSGIFAKDGLELVMVWAIPGEKFGTALDELTAAASDRIVAVVGGAMVDQLLGEALRQRFQPGEVTDNLLDPTKDRALGAFGPRIDIAFALGMYDESVRANLKKIAHIRNVFAHELVASFESPEKEFAKNVAGLNLQIGRTHYPSPLFVGDSIHEVEMSTSPRDRFLVNIKIALCLLMQDMVVHQPYSSIPVGWGPIHGIGKGA